MKQSFLGARKELRRMVASMESCLDVLTEIDNNDRPFDIAHLDMVKHIVPSDQDTDSMYDLNTSMEGLRENIKSGIDKVKDLVSRFKRRNLPPIYNLKTDDAIERIKKDLQKWDGVARGMVSIPYQYSGEQDPVKIIAAFEHDLKILEMLNSRFKSFYKEMEKLSKSLTSAVESDNDDLIDELDDKITKKILSSKSLIEGIPRLSNGEVFKVVKHQHHVEVESVGVRKEWIEKVRENDPVYVHACNRQQADKMLAMIIRAGEILDDLPYIETDYAQSELMWMLMVPYSVADHIDSCFTYIDASIHQRHKAKPSTESDTDYIANNGQEIIHEDPLLLISRKLIQCSSLREGVLKLNTSYLGSMEDKNGADVLNTVKKSLPWILELAKGSTAYAKALQNAVVNKIDPADVAVINFFPLCKGESGHDLSMTFSVEVADSIFEEEVKIRCPRARGYCQQYDLQPISIVDMSRIVRYLEQIRLFPVDRITSSDAEVDEKYLKSAQNALTQWHSHFIPELTKWMLASFGDPI